SIRFGYVRREAILTGGPEDGLTLYQRYGGHMTVYVSCGEAMLHLVQLPGVVRAVTIARQNDDAGVAASRRTDEAMKAQGRSVRHVAPKPAFKDWNDEERGIARDR